MSRSIRFLDRILYPSFSGNWDDDLFRERILACIQPSTELLDVGAGAGIVHAMRFHGIAHKVCGIDLDPRVLENPHLDEGRIADAGHIPYGDSVFDLVFADNVMEHSPLKPSQPAPRYSHSQIPTVASYGRDKDQNWAEGACLIATQSHVRK